MRTVRFFKLYFVFLSCFVYGLNIGAQQDCPDRAYLEKVSVDPVTGLITIQWNVPSPQTSGVPVDKFGLYWYEAKPSPNYIQFKTVPNTDRSFTFDYDAIKLLYPNMPDPRKTSVGFAVRSESNPFNQNCLYSVRHHNLQVTNSYDSCKSEIKLNWYRYQGWTANTLPNKPLVSYHVMRIPGGEVAVLSPNDTSYIIRNVADRDVYTYYIEARRDGETATSYATTRITHMPIPPTYISAESTKYNGDGLAEISFRIDPAAETHSYELLGSSKPEYAFVPLGTFNIYGDTVLTDIQVREKTYYYRLEAWHICKNKITATSNTATALWLTLKQEGTENLLFWDPYRDWGGDAQYNLYRMIGANPEEVISNFADPAATAYRDDLSNVLIDGEVCYWVVANPVSPNSGLQETAISNMVCIKPESNIFIPKAFTPNVAGINSEFKPFFSYPPVEYMLFVYDRNGAKVFETKDIDAGWNGQFLNGKPASEGVYTYYLKFRTELGRLVEKRGTFSLILP